MWLGCWAETFDFIAPCCRYKDLWNGYLDGRQQPETSREIWRLLQGWRTWGESHMTLTSHERLLTMGPTNRIITFSRGTINGLKLRTKRLYEGKKSCNSFFWVEYDDNGELNYDVGRAEYFFLHNPPGHIMLEEERMVPFVKAHWYWWPNPRKNKVGLQFLTTIEMKNIERGAFISPVWLLDQISNVGVSVAPVDDYHHVPRNIKLGTPKLHRHELWVVIESRRRLSHDVESIDILDAFRCVQ